MGVLQAKATDSISYARTHLDKYPDIKVVVPRELVLSAPETTAVLSSSGLSDAVIPAERGAQLQEWGESVLAKVIHHGAEYALDGDPVVSIGVTVLKECQCVLTGRSMVCESVRSGSTRVAEASIWTSAGAALTAAGVGDPISAAAIVGARAHKGRVNKYSHVADTLESSNVEIKRLLPADAVTAS